MVRDLKGTLEREKAAIGLFITLEEPTKEMHLETDTAGLFHSDLWNRDYPRLQVLTIRELLEEGHRAQLPPFVLPGCSGRRPAIPSRTCISTRSLRGWRRFRPPCLSPHPS